MPAVWVQAYARVWLSGSRLALPSRVTAALSATVWSAPALAAGAVLLPTVIVTVSAVETSPPGSVTVRLKTRSVFDATAGAVKVGLAAVALDSVTFVPEVWVQA